MLKKYINIKNYNLLIKIFWILNLLDLFKSFFYNKRYCILNFNIFFCFFNFCLVFDKKEKIFFKIYFKTFFDLVTIRNCFAMEEYNIFKIDYLKKINNLKNKDKKLIIDCGANIGCSAIYFSKLFANSNIVSIESDRKNFSILKKNCKDKNYYNINSALASDRYFYKRIKRIDNRANAIKISNSETKNKSITVNEILNSYKETIYDYFLIKIDIEGSEKDLFSKNLQWVNKFKIIIIELHDWMTPRSRISHSFLKYISKLNSQKNSQRDLLIFGENLISIKNKI
jgi:FkbM family methyltransferase